MTVLEQWLKDRKEALKKAVVDDDWQAVRRYCQKYGVQMPKGNDFKAGVYKATMYVTDISDEIKKIAFEKCLRLGYSPFIKPYEGEEE